MELWQPGIKNPRIEVCDRMGSCSNVTIFGCQDARKMTPLWQRGTSIPSGAFSIEPFVACWGRQRDSCHNLRLWLCEPSLVVYLQPINNNLTSCPATFKSQIENLCNMFVHLQNDKNRGNELQSAICFVSALAEACAHSVPVNRITQKLTIPKCKSSTKAICTSCHNTSNSTF